MPAWESRVSERNQSTECDLYPIISDNAKQNLGQYDDVVALHACDNLAMHSIDEMVQGKPKRPR